MQTADLILKSTNIFTATSETAFDGYVAIEGDKILAVEQSQDYSPYVGADTRVLELGDKVVCPGFVDVHTFFSGYVMRFVGVDLSRAISADDILAIAREYASKKPSDKTLLGHGWNSSKISLPDSSILDREFGERPIILFANSVETCWMNTAAQEKYQFTPETCYPDAYFRLFEEILQDREFIPGQFKDYMAMLNKRGITAIKEMGFDNFYGFVDILEEMEKKNELTLRVAFMSQPMAAPSNMDHGKAMRERLTGKFVEFSGYNRMTDDSISCLGGYLKEPYDCAPDTCCGIEIDYQKIEAETLEIDADSFRYALHSQGDAAVAKALDIFDKCRKENGKLINRHAITDLELTDPIDLERMGKLGVVAEIYPQIMSLSDKESKLAMIKEKIGMERGRYFWNRRKLADSGVVISCGTDLPMLFPDIPESIYHACGGFFPEGGEPFNKENTLTRAEVLTAWTKGGQYNLSHEDILGTLEAGKLADIAVLDQDVLNIEFDKIRNTKVCLTIVNGKPVYNTLY